MPQPNEDEDKNLEEEDDDVEEGADDGATPEDDDEGGEPAGDDTDDPAELRRQRDAAFARAKKAESKLQASKNRPPAKKPGAPAPKGTVREEDVEDFVDLRVAGYSREEIREIRDFARTKGISAAAAAKHSFVLAGIEAMRAKAKAKAATPSPSNRPAPAAPARPAAANSRGELKQKFIDAMDRKARSRG